MNIVYSQISSISDDNFKSSNFTENSILNKSLENVEIIALGEPSHYMKETYVSKIKLIKYLHKKLNFDVLAFEAPMYNLNQINDSVRLGLASSKLFRQNNAGVWNIKEMDELYEYIIETYKTDRPLIYVGFDQSFYKSNIFIPELKSFLKEKNVTNIDDRYFDAIQFVVEHSFSFKKSSVADTALISSTNKEILSKISEKNFKNKFWKKQLQNIESVYRNDYKVGNRDETMFENVKFIKEEMYPNKKMILWGATIHFVDNTLLTVDKLKTLKTKVGYFLKKEYKDKYYILGFTPGEGNAGVKGYLGLMNLKIKSPKNSVENLIQKNCECNYAFVSFNGFDSAKLTSNIIGSKQFEYDNLSKIVDGLFYLKTETLINFKEEQ
ncbi:erythromycin esterase family protein [Empedobacter stercoris]|uniref:erythromycin esterase family protein n=1 Tax=Empedobacter stercoris TaxID=1628248 RepID=UPI0016627DA8|nr:erythromycin esterase family protein [Empedobacter stercoris]MCA4810171.1 erythromycin esterase family protein [Empedobacter stercoris]QNT14965.1 erythromycin esterase family protein [Empedobacter stercoris]